MDVTLYSKPECALCEEVKRDLLDLQRSVDFALVERNILDDEQEFARFQYLIPVVDIEGGEVLYPPHDWLTLERALRAAMKTLDGTLAG